MCFQNESLQAISLLSTLAASEHRHGRLLLALKDHAAAGLQVLTMTVYIPKKLLMQQWRVI